MATVILFFFVTDGHGNSWADKTAGKFHGKIVRVPGRNSCKSLEIAVTSVS